MASEEPDGVRPDAPVREGPDGAGDGTGESLLAMPVDPPRVRRPGGGERHLTRRVIAPAALLLVSVPVVALLLLNLRAVSDDSTPASAGTSASATATPSTTASPTAGASATPAGPQVSALSVVSGPVAGGQVLTIVGTDLDPVTQVLFGALSGADLDHVSSTQIRVTTPAGTAGRVPLVVRSGAETLRTLAYTYE